MLTQSLRHHHLVRRLLIPSTLLLALAVTAPLLAAGGGVQGRIDQLAQSMAALQRSDTGGQTTAEIEAMRTLVSQAQAFIASDKPEKANPLLDRAETTGKLVAAKQARVAAEQAAQQAEQKAAAADKKANAMQRAADAAGKQMHELEKKGL